MSEIILYLKRFLWQFVTVTVTFSATEYDDIELEEKFNNRLNYLPEDLVTTLEIVNKGCNSIVCIGSTKSPIEIYPGMSKTFGADGFKRIKVCHSIWFKPEVLTTDCDESVEPIIEHKVQFIKEYIDTQSLTK